MSGIRGGRTYFWGKDAGWWRRERIVLLGREFGAAGPAVIDWLSCEAAVQNDGGWVKSGPTAVGAGCFVDPETVCPVLSLSVRLGLIEDYQESGGLFTCRISGWKADQEVLKERIKKREQRAQQAAKSEVTAPECPPLSPAVPSVPDCPPTEQNRTEELQPPNPLRGNRTRNRLVFDEEVQAYTVGLGIDHEDGWQNVKGAIQAGAATNDEVLAWVQKYRPDVLPLEVAV